ncbi:SRSX-29 protein [Aphelenchoides avenae]|nr:SRSX-29 protein [Aphelenchus avenae]
MGGICDSTHQMSDLFFAYVVFSGRNFVPLSTCCWVQAVPLIGFCSGVLITLLVGIDRLLYVALSRKHKATNECVWLGISLVTCGTYSGIMLFLSHTHQSVNPSKPVPCTIAETTPGETWFYACLLLNLITLICYGVVWYALKAKIQSASRGNRAFKAITMVMLAEVGGWTFNSIVRITVSNVESLAFYRFTIGAFAGLSVKCACACHVFLLHKFSTDHRKALEKLYNSVSTALSNRKVFTENVTSGSSGFLFEKTKKDHIVSRMSFSSVTPYKYFLSCV